MFRRVQDLLASAVNTEIKLGQADISYQCMNKEKQKSVCASLHRAMQSNLKSKYAGIRVSDVCDKKTDHLLKTIIRKICLIDCQDE